MHDRSSITWLWWPGCRGPEALAREAGWREGLPIFVPFFPSFPCILPPLTICQDTLLKEEVDVNGKRQESKRKERTIWDNLKPLTAVTLLPSPTPPQHLLVLFLLLLLLLQPLLLVLPLLLLLQFLMPLLPCRRVGTQLWIPGIKSLTPPRISHVTPHTTCTDQ